MRSEMRLSLRYKALAAALRAGAVASAKVPAEMLVRPTRAACAWAPNLNRPLMVAGGRYAYTRETCGGVRCLSIGSAGDAERGVIVYLHGGGYVVGTPHLGKGVGSQLSFLTNMKVVMPAYRLAPEHPLPSAVDDAEAVILGLLECGVPPDRISLVGESAGGGLLLLALQRMRDKGRAAVRCAVPVSPWTNLACDSASLDVNHDHDAMLGGQPRESFHIIADMAVGNRDLDGKPTGAAHDRSAGCFSPLNAPFGGLPPLFFLAGGSEVLLDDAVEAHHKALAAGVDSRLAVVPKMCHSFPVFTPVIPEAVAAVKDIADFIMSRALPVPSAPSGGGGEPAAVWGYAPGGPAPSPQAPTAFR